MSYSIEESIADSFHTLLDNDKVDRLSILAVALDFADEELEEIQFASKNWVSSSHQPENVSWKVGAVRTMMTFVGQLIREIQEEDKS